MPEYVYSDVEKEQAKARLVKGTLPEGVRVFYVGLTVEEEIVYALRKKLELLKGEGHGNVRSTEQD